VRAHSELAEEVVRAAHRVAVQRLHPNPTPSSAERLAVVAVGGFGRAEMAPHSDVDLLFVTPWKMTGWAESVIESTLYMLWDLHLKVGHASRTVADCVRLAKSDMTIRTGLLEKRRIAGDLEPAEDLSHRLRREVFSQRRAEFVQAKLEERAQRHRRHGDNRYVNEPNVKEGKGGLRDLHSLFWIARHIHDGASGEELVALRVFSREELDAFRAAEDFLWAVRCHLHLVAGRPTEQLTFDMQVEVAARMGYEDAPGRRAVERFMQDYFRVATRVGELTRIFLAELEARHIKREPSLLGRAAGRLPGRRPRVRPGYRVVHNRLTISDPGEFLADPVNLLRVFEEGLRTGLLLHPDVMRLIRANLGRIDGRMRQDPEARRIFLALLLDHGNPERALRRMNELGVLAAFIPEFEPVVAMMQFNMYHQFTVDEHLIQAVAQLSRIERGDLAEELPVASRIMAGEVDRRVLYLAVLLHDIGKGRPEDHSILGARIARRVLPRLGLPAAEVETVEWLVRHHLVMSDAAQKRDLSDPLTVRDFARTVRTRRRLDLLLVLTVCDIRAVGPRVWNNWKAQLLRTLHRRTALALEEGLEALGRESQEAEARTALEEALAGWTPEAREAELARHYGPYWQGLRQSDHAALAELLRDVPPDEIHMDIALDEGRDATRARFAMVDHPGIFARLTGAVALAGANVVDARTYTTRDGCAVAVFWLQDAEGHPFEEARLPRLRASIERILAGEVVAADALAPKDRVPRRERPFRRPTHITFDNEGSEIYTIVEVDTRDRPGLLHDLTRALAAGNIHIASAVVATYGEQAVDSFYVKDSFGLKLHSESRREGLERRLRAAIEQGVERARG
jgi:[protein-PII] uridylyltransferase